MQYPDYIEKAIVNLGKQIVLQDIKGYSFSIAFSGGKDSTAVLLLFFEALKRLPKEYKEKQYYINIADTLMEMPIYEIYLLETINKLKKYIKDNNLNIKINIVKPKLKNKFFNLVIGKGQPLPRRDFRWCSERLKILPQQNFMKQFEEKNIVITGLRKEESASRKNQLEQTDYQNGIKMKDGKVTMFALIENWKLKNVWDTIFTIKQEWLDANKLHKLYNYANEKMAKYPDARFGCWLCPLLNKDSTLINLTKHIPQYKYLLAARDYIVSFQNVWFKNNEPVRDVYNHKNHKIYVYNLDNYRKNMIMPGGFNLKTRKEFFKKIIIALAKTKKLLPNFPADIYLSTQDVIYIQQQWFLEGDFQLSAFKLVKELFKKELDLPVKEQLYRVMLKIIIELNLDTRIKFAFESENLNGMRSEIQMIKRFIDVLEKKEELKIKNREEIYQLIIEYLKNRDNLKQQMREEGFYFGDNEFENYVYWEWKNDEVGYWSFLERYERGEIEKPKEKSLFEGIHKDEWEKYFEIKEEVDNVEDILDSEKLSLEDKIRYLESFRKNSYFR